MYRGGADPSGVLELCRSLAAERVAVDAPGGLSVGAHRDDLSVARKFRSGRCSEIPVPGLPPVSWVTPTEEVDVPGWMRTGFRLWDRLRGAGLELVEAFPAAAFYGLNGRRWPAPKSTAAGRAARAHLVSGLVTIEADVAQWTHDDLDALATACVAARGRPFTHDCPCPDGSVMWGLE